MCEMRIEIWHDGKKEKKIQSCVMDFSLPLNNISTFISIYLLYYCCCCLLLNINMIRARKAHSFQGKQIIFCVSIPFSWVPLSVGCCSYHSHASFLWLIDLFFISVCYFLWYTLFSHMDWVFCVENALDSCGEQRTHPIVISMTSHPMRSLKSFSFFPSFKCAASIHSLKKNPSSFAATLWMGTSEGRITNHI